MINCLRNFLLPLFALTIFAGTVSGQTAKRVVSLAPSLTKNVYALQAEDMLVGCTSYCELAKKDNKAIVATAIKVNLESVLKVRPDLVIATTITNEEVIRSLEKFNIEVQVFPTPKSFDEISSQFIRLGTLLGKQDLAEEIRESTRNKIDILMKSTNGKPRQKIFLQIGAKPLYTVYPNTFMDDYITFAGGENIAGDLTMGTITRETVLVRNPDVIIIVTMGIVGDEEKEVWQSYKHLSATKQGKIFVIDSDRACSPTPENFVQTLEEIIKLIY